MHGPMYIKFTDTNIIHTNVPKQTNLPKQIYRLPFNLYTTYIM